MLGTDTRALQVLDRRSPLSHTLALPTLFPQKPSHHSWLQMAHLITSQEHVIPLEIGHSCAGQGQVVEGYSHNAPQI